MTQPFKLSPSELTFLWSECPRCFYLKVARGMARPPSAMPAIFQRIDRLMKGFFQGRSTAEIAPGLPAGHVRFADNWVQSAPISLPGRQAQVYIRGKFDSVVEFTSGGYGVVDFKTTEPRVEHVRFYSRQLRAYAYALEHPAPGKLALAPVTHLGLLSVAPDAMDRDAAGRIGYLGRIAWQPISVDEPGFLSFLGQVVAVLESPEPPAADSECVWCRYRDEARASGL